MSQEIAKPSNIEQASKDGSMEEEFDGAEFISSAIAPEPRYNIPVFNIGRERAFERPAELMKIAKRPNAGYSIG